MSTLRDIMKKLANKKYGISSSDQIRYNTRDIAEQLKYKVDAYQENLEKCTPAMLQYEWTRLRQHIETLTLCISNSSMCDEIGGQTSAEVQLEESRQFAVVLEDEFKKRMLHPHHYTRPVEAAKHAWELSLESTRKEWGLD